jgi:hypothetical protein
MATDYGLDGPGFEDRCWGSDFLYQSRPAVKYTQTPPQWVLGIFPKGNTAGMWR